MSISFNNIPTTLRVPWVYIEFSNEKAIQGVTQQPYTTLMVGQKLSPGTAPYNVPVLVTSDAQADSLFGVGSMLSQMVRMYRKSDGFTKTWCLPVEDSAAGVAATGKIAVTGQALEAGTITLYLGGHRVPVGVTVGKALADIGTAIADAINATNGLAVTAAAGAMAGEVDVTCRWKGLTGNDIDIRENFYSGEATPKGLTVTITGMAGGTSNPDVTTALAAAGDDVHYNIIVFPYSDGNNLRILDEELQDRWGPMRQLEGLAFTSIRGALAELGTFGDGSNTQNLSVIHAAGLPNSPWEVASSAAGIAAFYGNIDPARPFQTLPMTGLLPARMEDRFTLQERNILLYDGISTWKVDDGGVVRAERFITTYKKSPAGADDRSYLDITTPLTLGRLRYSLRNFLLLRYPRHKLASGDITQFGAGQAIATPDSVKGDVISWYSQHIALGLVENMKLFKEGLIVERNMADENRLDILLTPDVVNQLMVMAAKMEFRL